MIEIYPCLWFDGMATKAASFYASIFRKAKVLSDNGMVVNFEIAGRKFMALNGGPQYSINASTSFFIFCPSIAEVNRLWDLLIIEGKVMMPIDSYPWSSQYGWCRDRFGVHWQVMVSQEQIIDPTIIPALMYNHDMAGKAAEAIDFYTAIFPNSSIDKLNRYQEGQGDVQGYISHGRFMLNGLPFVAFDSSQPLNAIFNESISWVVSCQNQSEIDYYWQKLTDGGQESQCGWLKDKYGVSWQIVPDILGDLMQDAISAPKVTEAFLKMKKMDINKVCHL